MFEIESLIEHCAGQVCTQSVGKMNMDSYWVCDWVDEAETWIPCQGVLWECSNVLKKNEKQELY